MEESILNHGVAISRIKDCKDDMQVCKGDIDAVKIEQASMGRDIRMLEGAMGVIAADFSILFQSFTTQLSTLSSFYFPHSPHKTLKTLTKQQQTIMIVSFTTPPPLFIQDRTTRWNLHWRPYRTGRSTNRLRTPGDLPGYYHHAHR
jgi:hypothetical protein